MARKRQVVLTHLIVTHEVRVLVVKRVKQVVLLGIEIVLVVHVDEIASFVLAMSLYFSI